MLNDLPLFPKDFFLNIDDIVAAIHGNRIRITDHADEEAFSDKLTYKDIFNSILQGGVIENYPDDKPYPSCLIFGLNKSKEPIHSVWAFNPENEWAVLITVYRPDPIRWINWVTRRTKDDSL
jgi:hypothetical protein